MKPETASYLAKAKESLRKARIALSVDLADEAGRHAYHAAFHAAQALILERKGKASKTHTGVKSQFALLAKDDPEIGRELPEFLGQAYRLKSAADYETGSAAIVTVAQAAAAIETAERFVARITGVFTPRPDEAAPS